MKCYKLLRADGRQFNEKGTEKVNIIQVSLFQVDQDSCTTALFKKNHPNRISFML